jgi:hypothetical protein
MPGDYGLQNPAIPVTPAEDLGSSKMETLTGWAIFNAMAPLIRPQVFWICQRDLRADELSS